MATAAEDRLRELNLDAMGRYDTLRDTHTPAAALDEIDPLIDPALQTSTPAGPTDAGVTAASASPKAALPPEQRYAPVVHEVLQAELADQVLHDKAWPALAGALAKAEQLGAQPADLLAAAAGKRELSSAKSVADVLVFRIEQHQIPTQPGLESAPPRKPTAADLATSSYPTPLAAARPGSSAETQDLAALGAALELGREADTERQNARPSAGAVDDVSTPHLDQRREGLTDAQVRAEHAGADWATSTALLGQADTSRATTTAGAPATATAAHSYPTPIKKVSAAHAAPKATATAPAARTATRKAPATGRRR